MTLAADNPNLLHDWLASDGTLKIANTTGSATGSGKVSVNAAETLSGSGIIGGPVTVAGALSPGGSPGILTVNNQVTFETGSTFNVEVIGLAAELRRGMPIL